MDVRQKQTLRVFFAIDPPLSTKQKIAAHCIDVLKKTTPDLPIRWTQLDNLHITLQFISMMNTLDLPRCIDLISTEIKHIPPFKVTLGPILLFPNNTHPRYLSLTPEPQTELAHLSKKIGDGLKAFHYPPENRPFRGHLTVGKITAQPIHFAAIEQTPFMPIEPFLVQEITVFESRPTKERSIYTPLARIPLKRVKSPS